MSARRYSRPTGLVLAGVIALAPAVATPALASAGSSDLNSGSSQFGSSGQAAPLPELPAPSPNAVRLDAARNFRDIGGYSTADGKKVRTGVVYRSNKINSLTDLDLAKLTAANVTLDVDLRNASERQEAPDRIPSGVRYQVADVVGIDSGVWFHEFVPLTLGRAMIDAAVSGSSNIGQSIGYPFMVSYHGSDVAFGDLLKAIAHNDSGATMYHCSSGKDRTGWSTAVLLTLLGVPRDMVNADFMASNTYLGRPAAVELSWLNAAFDEMNRIYGSFDKYVRDGLGLDQTTVDTLRAKLLV
ncbi:tyrosine-protein phosphatase [Rhodococcus spelaei]|uniref:Tyrosine-protein phosphatase n=1 Tax=Rhodococcus spelaei TaxID=2546320 RepID=A0A541BSB6_9NOCA|nr:tyrosine-protein phosphatase [Rhodococcus spelaei]TQF75178.1 tyrosine-protein phosphatase [Rhodococcus spelaei]